FQWSFFGWFCLKPEDVEVPAFNYVGVAIACLSGAVFLAIRVGIVLALSTYYDVYILLKRNRPYVYVESILPAFISRIMWGIAQAGFILANSTLSQAISFPLISIEPTTVVALWSILYFKDVAALKNYLIFVFGTVLRIIVAVFNVLSKPTSN
ncbi:unnamed protein product, partial [Rotaria sp. Silwood1]